jgi:uncharacterized protein YfaA (DUF2138 family)
MSRPTPPAYKTRNWSAYNEALKRRGSLTIWFDPAMIWEAAPTGMGAALALASGLGIDPLIAAELLPEIEAVMVRKMNEQMAESAGTGVSF